MQITSTGDAHTGERCALCDGYHPVETAATRAKFLALGFRPEEVDAIFAEQARMAHGYGVPVVEPHVKPSDTKEARAERQARFKARRRAEKGAGNTE